MSQKFDKMPQSRLDAETVKALEKFEKECPLPVPRWKLVNIAVRRGLKILEKEITIKDNKGA